MNNHDVQDANATEAQFMIQRVYAKNVSYETTNTPQVFQQQWEPELSLDLGMKNTLLEPNVYEVVLTVTATVKNQQTTAFLVEIQQAGIFTIQGAPESQLDHILNTFCPAILFPYAREAITTEVTRGSFPQLVLTPINFDALYAQQLQERQKALAEQQTEHETH
jgi:preprotein translocase subunit SecB